MSLHEFQPKRDNLSAAHIIIEDIKRVSSPSSPLMIQYLDFRIFGQCFLDESINCSVYNRLVQAGPGDKKR